MTAVGPTGPVPGSLADSGPDADPESVARGIVLRKLTAAPRTRAQLAEDLARRNVPEDVATRVLDRFTEVGLIDDAAYAEAWVRSRQAGRGLARRALRDELRRKGVDDATIDDAVSEVSSDDERSGAETLVAKKLRSTHGLLYPTRVRRLVGMLARKGYPGGLAMAVVRDALAREAEEEADLPRGYDD